MIRHKMLAGLGCLVGVWMSVGRLGADPSPPSVADRYPVSSVGAFAINDYQGNPHALEQLPSSKILVLAFLGTECPLAKLYGPTLQQLATEYADRGVVVWGVNSNCQDSVSEIGAYVRQHHLEFPMLKDVGNRLADQLQARRTPEVFVLDGTRQIRYRGRIDDRFAVGVMRDEAKSQELRAALDELLAGKPVTIAQTEPVGCQIGRIKSADPQSTITYTKDIAPILQRRCVECHREGEIAPFSLIDYDEVVGWADMIQEVVETQRMPPWHANPAYGHFSNDRKLTDQEKSLIAQWVAAGAPEGDRADLPKPASYTSGWQLPREPDVVFPLTPEPVLIKAKGTVKYQYFVVDPGFDQDKWIHAAQLLPGNRAVVHHILAFARPPGKLQLDEDGGGARGFLVGYVPGMLVQPYPTGMAKKIPAGSQLLFQVHYTPIGSEQHDLSKLGIVFADRQQLTHEVKTTSAVQPRLRIPPGDANYQAEADSLRMPCDVDLLTFMPHMHLRGKSFRYTLFQPDQSSEVLLDVPHYDFNWQTAYRLAKPVRIPQGSWLHCEAHFDNSADNLNNPDPQSEVRWGEQTWEEMLIGYFDVAVPIDDAGNRWDTSVREQVVNEMATRLMRRFDKDRDGTVQRGEVPLLARLRFEAIDRDDDGVVTSDELLKSLREEAEKKGAGE